MTEANNQPSQNLVTFEIDEDLIPLDPVHISVHLKMYARSDFSPKAEESQAFQKMIDTMGQAIFDYKQDIGANKID